MRVVLGRKFFDMPFVRVRIIFGNERGGHTLNLARACRHDDLQNAKASVFRNTHSLAQAKTYSGEHEIG